MDEEARVERACVEKTQEDASSGMTTWIVQKFHKEVLAQCHSPHRSIREVALDIVVTAMRQGAVAPNWFIETLLSITDEPRALLCWEGLSERHGDTVASKAVGALVMSYHYHLKTHSATGANEIIGYIFSETSPHTSIHAPLYNFMSKQKKRRDDFLASTLRLIHTERGRQSWAPFSNYEEGFRICRFLTQCVAFLPLSLEEEAVHIIDQCTSAVNMADVDSLLRPRHKKASQKASVVPQSERDTTSPYHLLAVYVMLILKKFLRKEYGFNARRMKKYIEGHGTGMTPLPPREVGSKVAAAFLSELDEIVELAGIKKAEKDLLKALENKVGIEYEADSSDLMIALETAAAERSPNDSGDDGVTPVVSPKRGKSTRRVGPAIAASVRQTGASKRQKIAESSEEEEDDDESSDDSSDESEEINRKRTENVSRRSTRLSRLSKK